MERSVRAHRAAADARLGRPAAPPMVAQLQQAWAPVAVGESGGWCGARALLGRDAIVVPTPGRVRVIDRASGRERVDAALAWPAEALASLSLGAGVLVGLVGDGLHARVP